MIKKIIIGLFILLATASQLSATSLRSLDPVVIGLSLADLKEERWKRDRDMFTAEVEKIGSRVLVRDAGGDARVQIEQCSNLLSQGVKALVVIPKNADAAAPIVAAARKKGVHVISYDRLITQENPEVYISFDNFKVGEIQATEILKRAPKGKYLLLGGDPADQNAFMLREGQMKVLKPAIETGDIQIVADPFCDKWLRSEAARYTEDAISKHPDLVAIVASNDGTAGGAIAVLKAKNKAGQVVVSGQDADIEAVRNVAKGLQAVTVYKPIRKIAEFAANVAVILAQSDSFEATDGVLSGGKSWDAHFQRLKNGAFETNTYFIDPVPVTRDNIDATVIADGFHTREQVYAE